MVGYTTFCMYLVTLNFILKMVKMANFMFTYIYFTIILKILLFIAVVNLDERSFSAPT